MRSSWLEFSMRRRVAEPLRVLVAGWLNSPHVTAWVEAVEAAGHDVHLAGRDAPQLPASASNEKVHRLPAGAPPLVRGLRMSHALARVAADVSPDLVHKLQFWRPNAKASRRMLWAAVFYEVKLTRRF